MYVSTHSPHVLDIVWAMNLLKRHSNPACDVLRIFQLRSTPTIREVAEAALGKEYRVFYFCCWMNRTDVACCEDA